MKFGALLRESAHELPELEDLFRTYKQLKKNLKRLPERQQLVVQSRGERSSSDAQAFDRALNLQEFKFVQALNEDVQQFNDTFIEREETSVIRLKDLEDKALLADDSASLQQVYKQLVDFHGEMLLLVHWSILAYTGLVKILKKHHKRTGLLVTAPNLVNLLSQPFCSVEVMTELVKRAEDSAESLARRLGQSSSSCSMTSAQLLNGSGSLQDVTRRLSCDSGEGSVEEDSSEDEADGRRRIGCGGAQAPETTAAPGELDTLDASAAQPRAQALKRSRTSSGHDGPSVPATSAGAHAEPDSPAPQRPCTLAAQASLTGTSDAMQQHIDRVTQSLRSDSAPAVQKAAEETATTADEGLDAMPAASTIFQQTQAALCLWEQLKETASTPSTVMATSFNIPHVHQRVASNTAASAGTGHSSS